MLLFSVAVSVIIYPLDLSRVKIREPFISPAAGAFTGFTAA